MFFLYKVVLTVSLFLSSLTFAQEKMARACVASIAKTLPKVSAFSNYSGLQKVKDKIHRAMVRLDFSDQCLVLKVEKEATLTPISKAFSEEEREAHKDRLRSILRSLSVSSTLLREAYFVAGKKSVTQLFIPRASLFKKVINWLTFGVVGVLGEINPVLDKVQEQVLSAKGRAPFYILFQDEKSGRVIDLFIDNGFELNIFAAVNE